VRCRRVGDIIVKSLPSEGSLCSECNEKRLRLGKDVKKSSIIKKKEKPTGESVMFETIWNTRPRVSFITGLPLGMEARSFFFAHVLPKSTYPDYRLLMENVVLLTFDEHQKWDQRSEEHTSELQSRFGISYAVFCLKKKKIHVSITPD